MKLAKAKRATLRFKGSKGVEDYEITRAEIKGVNAILNGFDALEKK